jgi:dephospho-CoA kinase
VSGATVEGEGGAAAVRPFRVGLTGNIAAGKSTVADLWVARGAALVDADRLARRAVAPGSDGLRRVVEAFGEEIVGSDGALDRAALGRRVFADPAARERLEAIVHPEVARLRPLAEREALERAAAAAQPAGSASDVDLAGAPAIAVHDIPLRFEAGLEDEVDLVVLVHAPAAARRERLIRDRGMDAAEADDRIEAQMPSEEKIRRADIVIENDGDLAALGRAAEAAWRAVVEAAAASPDAGVVSPDAGSALPDAEPAAPPDDGAAAGDDEGPGRAEGAR